MRQITILLNFQADLTWRCFVVNSIFQKSHLHFFGHWLLFWLLAAAAAHALQSTNDFGDDTIIWLKRMHPLARKEVPVTKYFRQEGGTLLLQNIYDDDNETERSNNTTDNG